MARPLRSIRVNTAIIIVFSVWWDVSPILAFLQILFKIVHLAIYLVNNFIIGFLFLLFLSSLLLLIFLHHIEVQFRNDLFEVWDQSWGALRAESLFCKLLLHFFHDLFQVLAKRFEWLRFDPVVHLLQIALSEHLLELFLASLCALLCQKLDCLVHPHKLLVFKLWNDPIRQPLLVITKQLVLVLLVLAEFKASLNA